VLAPLLGHAVDQVHGGDHPRPDAAVPGTVSGGPH